MPDIKSQVLGLRSIAVAGSKALLERPRNFSSPLDQLLLKRHLQTHCQSVQPDPQPSKSKGVRKTLATFPCLSTIDCPPPNRLWESRQGGTGGGVGGGSSGYITSSNSSNRWRRQCYITTPHSRISPAMPGGREDSVVRFV